MTVAADSGRFGWMVAIAGLLGFVAVAIVVQTGVTQTMDEQVLLSMRNADATSVPIGPVWLAGTVRDITSLGGYAVLVLVSVTAMLFFSLAGERRRTRILAATIVPGFLISMGLKAVFARPRPTLVTHLSTQNSASYPSGHAMMSAIVYISIALALRMIVKRELRTPILLLAVGLSLVIGVTRVYLGMHYPTDVIAGWSAGFAWCGLASQAERRLSPGS